MRVLIVGGTRFVGRHLTEALATPTTEGAAGHEVWLANRGRTSTELFGAAGRITIDRGHDVDLSELERHVADAGPFDAVVDVSAYHPAQVAALSDVLGDRIGRYLLISTVSVYDTAGAASDPTETAGLLPAIEQADAVTSETYGGLKVACEALAADRYGDRLTVVRPGIVAGPHDHTDRLTWWVRFLGRSTPTPLPDRRDQPVQAIDARDLAAFCRRLLDDDTAGTFDATGAPIDLATLAAEVTAVVGTSWVDGPVGPTWVDPDRWGETPLPPLVLDDPAGADMFARDSTRSVAAGLHRRPLRETLTDLQTWDVERGQPPLAAEPSAEQVEALRRRLG